MHSPSRLKLLLLGASTAGLIAILLAQGASVTTAARFLLALTAVASLAVWWRRARPGLRFELPPRVAVVQRVGLSPRTGLTLIEVDGRGFLVVHGDGFAKVQRLSRTRERAARRVLATDEVTAHEPVRLGGRPS